MFALLQQIEKLILLRWYGPLTQFKRLQRHGEARLLGAHQRPVTGAEVLTGGQQQQHGHVFTKLQQLLCVHTILVGLPESQRGRNISF